MPPWIGAGSARLSSVTVPILLCSGHWPSSEVPYRDWAKVQDTFPSADDELIEKPAGSVVMTALISESEGVVGLSFCGTWSSVSRPLAESAASVDGFAACEGLKFSWSQPVATGHEILSLYSTWS